MRVAYLSHREIAWYSGAGSSTICTYAARHHRPASIAWYTTPNEAAIGDQQMANNPSASERQAAIQTMKAWQEARDTHLPGSKEYNVLHEEYKKALTAYHNLGK